MTGEDARKIVKQAAEAERQTVKVGLVGEGGWTANDALPRALAVVVADLIERVDGLTARIDAISPPKVSTGV
ncbi:MAG TPA: hypothetical protein VGG82_07585 [Casimicrobiaceae bacterium]